MVTKSGTRLGTRGAAGAVLQEQEAAQGTRSEEPSQDGRWCRAEVGTGWPSRSGEQSQVVEGVDR